VQLAATVSGTASAVGSVDAAGVDALAERARTLPLTLQSVEYSPA
jgi:hypothetical protein